MSDGIVGKLFGTHFLKTVRVKTIKIPKTNKEKPNNWAEYWAMILEWDRKLMIASLPTTKEKPHATNQ